MILQFASQLGPWSWVLLGLVLLALEIVVPGNVFVWFGVAGILTGAVAFFTDFGWQGDLIVFVGLALVLVIIGRRVFARSAQPGERPFLNDRAHRLVGSAYVLAAPIVDGRGSVHIDDTTWRVVGPDLPSGTKVKVVDADGPVLKVEAAG